MKQTASMVRFFLPIFLMTFIIPLRSQNCIWSKSATGTIGQEKCIATDKSGNAYVAGTFTGTSVTFGTKTLYNNDITGKVANLFLVKYDSTGKVIWAKSVGAATN